jgi:hypothetical protein
MIYELQNLLYQQLQKCAMGASIHIDILLKWVTKGHLSVTPLKNGSSETEKMTTKELH